jgi:hypothetical protein|tara:strand:+ start:552 stop:842 length:291 start_codon:yes stop_codon:yes gene_type:complete
MDKTEFFLELQQLYQQIEDLVEKHGVEEQFACIMVGGLMRDRDEFSKEFKGLYHYSIDDAVELEQIIDFIYNTFNRDNDIDKGLDDLLDGTGISLN